MVKLIFSNHAGSFGMESVLEVEMFPVPSTAISLKPPLTLVRVL